jgi:hypothetical protein
VFIRDFHWVKSSARSIQSTSSFCSNLGSITSKFLPFPPANHHSTIVPYSSITTPVVCDSHVRQHNITSLSWGLRCWPKGKKLLFNFVLQKESINTKCVCDIVLPHDYAQTQISCFSIDKYDITYTFIVLMYVAHWLKCLA